MRLKCLNIFLSKDCGVHRRRPKFVRPDFLRPEIGLSPVVVQIEYVEFVWKVTGDEEWRSFFTILLLRRMRFEVVGSVRRDGTFHVWG